MNTQAYNHPFANESSNFPKEWHYPENDTTRDQVAKLLGCDPDDVTYISASQVKDWNKMVGEIEHASTRASKKVSFDAYRGKSEGNLYHTESATLIIVPSGKTLWISGKDSEQISYAFESVNESVAPGAPLPTFESFLSTKHAVRASESSEIDTGKFYVTYTDEDGKNPKLYALKSGGDPMAFKSMKDAEELANAPFRKKDKDKGIIWKAISGKEAASVNESSKIDTGKFYVTYTDQKGENPKVYNVKGDQPMAFKSMKDAEELANAPFRKKDKDKGIIWKAVTGKEAASVNEG